MSCSTVRNAPFILSRNVHTYVVVKIDFCSALQCVNESVTTMYSDQYVS